MWFFVKVSSRNKSTRAAVIASSGLEFNEAIQSKLIITQLEDKLRQNDGA